MSASRRSRDGARNSEIGIIRKIESNVSALGNKTQNVERTGEINTGIVCGSRDVSSEVGVVCAIEKIGIRRGCVIERAGCHRIRCSITNSPDWYIQRERIAAAGQNRSFDGNVAGGRIDRNIAAARSQISQRDSVGVVDRNSAGSAL